MSRIRLCVALSMALGVNAVSNNARAQPDPAVYLRAVQTALRSIGYQVEPNGVLDGDTVLALQAAQRACELFPTGRVDSTTTQCLRDTLQKRVAQLQQALHTYQELSTLLQTPPPASLASASQVPHGIAQPSTRAPVRTASTARSAETTYILAVQQALQSLGYRLEANGLFDGNTLLAVRVFQKSEGLAATDQIDGATARALNAKLPPKLRNTTVANALQVPPPQPLSPATYSTASPSTSSFAASSAASASFGTADQVIRSKCVADWPDDFAMRAYCEKQQRQAIGALEARAMTSSDRQMIRNKCERDWPDDFKMRDYCEGRQLEAMQSLR